MQMHSGITADVRKSRRLSGKIIDSKVISVLEKLKMFFVNSIQNNQNRAIMKVSGYLSIVASKFNRFGY